MGKISNLLFYAGIERENYRKIRPKIEEANRRAVVTVSCFATVLIFAVFVSSLFVDGVRMNRGVYTVGFIVSLLLFICSILASKLKIPITPLIAAAYSIFYIYGILIGTITSPNDKTVTFMVLLVFLPNLFVDRPIHMASVTALYVGIFIFLCFQTKSGDILGNDVIDAIIFGLLGVSTGFVTAHKMVRGYYSEYLNTELGQKDKLTGMKNRNAYEMELYEMPEKCKEALACIYIDANGLKQLNDNHGHKKGDEMLKTLAGLIRKYFGEELSYRIGGDEFVVFMPDPGYCEISKKAEALMTEIEDSGFHAAVGWKIHDLDCLSMTTLIKDAEGYMYQKKSDFYKNSEFDRRVR